MIEKGHARQGTLVILDDDMINNDAVLGKEFQDEIDVGRQLFTQESLKSDGDTDKMLEISPERQMETAIPKIVQKK